MNVSLDKLRASGDRPGYGTLWRFHDLPELQLAQGLYGGTEWSIVRSGDGFFFLHQEEQSISRLAQHVLDRAGNRPYRRKQDALRAYDRVMRG